MLHHSLIKNVKSVGLIVPRKEIKFAVFHQTSTKKTQEGSEKKFKEERHMRKSMKSMNNKRKKDTRTMINICCHLTKREKKAKGVKTRMIKNVNLKERENLKY